MPLPTWGCHVQSTQRPLPAQPHSPSQTTDPQARQVKFQRNIQWLKSSQVLINVKNIGWIKRWGRGKGSLIDEKTQYLKRKEVIWKVRIIPLHSMKHIPRKKTIFRNTKSQRYLRRSFINKKRTTWDQERLVLDEKHDFRIENSNGGSTKWYFWKLSCWIRKIHWETAPDITDKEKEKGKGAECDKQTSNIPREQSGDPSWELQNRADRGETFKEI